jgi:hypothetical protein
MDGRPRARGTHRAIPPASPSATPSSDIKASGQRYTVNAGALPTRRMRFSLFCGMRLAAAPASCCRAPYATCLHIAKTRNGIPPAGCALEVSSLFLPLSRGARFRTWAKPTPASLRRWSDNTLRAWCSSAAATGAARRLCPLLGRAPGIPSPRPGAGVSLPCITAPPPFPAAVRATSAPSASSAALYRLPWRPSPSPSFLNTVPAAAGLHLAVYGVPGRA